MNLSANIHKYRVLSNENPSLPMLRLYGQSHFYIAASTPWLSFFKLSFLLWNWALGLTLFLLFISWILLFYFCVLTNHVKRQIWRHATQTILQERTGCPAGKRTIANVQLSTPSQCSLQRATLFEPIPFPERPASGDWGVWGGSAGIGKPSYFNSVHDNYNQQCFL